MGSAGRGGEILVPLRWDAARGRGAFGVVRIALPVSGKTSKYQHSETAERGQNNGSQAHLQH
jgi:hypothetical protein